MRERYTISTTAAARRAKRCEVVLSWDDPDDDEEWDREMRQAPATDRAVRHRPDTQPEGESWVSVKISRE